MEFSVKSGSPEKQRSACIVVGVFEPRRLSPIAEQLDKISDGYISALLRRGELEGKPGQTLLLHHVPNILSERILLIGCGKERELALQNMASNVFVHNLVAEYIVRLVMATRNPVEFGMPDLDPVISVGASSRATLGLVAAARALALIHGRDYVLPTDVQAVAQDVMAHRLVLGFDAIADNISPVQVVERLIAMVPAPTPVWNDQQRQQARTEHHYEPGRVHP